MTSQEQIALRKAVLLLQKNDGIICQTFRFVYSNIISGGEWRRRESKGLIKGAERVGEEPVGEESN